MGTLAFLVATLACTAAQNPVPTRFSDFVVDRGQAYLPSPVFPVRPVSAYLRMKWSGDGRRLGFVGGFDDATPRAFESRIAKAGEIGAGSRLSVWNRDTGRVTDFDMGAQKLGVGEFAFLGHSLLFTTSSSSGAEHRLWMVREGDRAQPIDLPGWDGGGHLAASRRREAVLMVTPAKMWLLDAQQTRELKTPSHRIFRFRGVTADDRAVIAAMTADQRPVWLLVDFVTGEFRAVDEEPASLSTPSKRPFILDAYKLQRRKADLLENDSSAQNLDGPQVPPVDEDRGWCLDLVERQGAPRRRLPFIPEMGRFVEVSDDGLSFAYVSNRMLMVRSLVPADRELNRRLMGG